ncbi:MAG: hypothetical protein KA190_24800 [Kofleriaceae bacterium]|nr:hypothetical protein [Kofleriaceae bacterium]
MRRRLLLIAMAAPLLVAGLSDPLHATLEGQTFTAASDGVRLTVPRGWRASEQATYPGVVLWLRRTRPPGVMLLSSEVLTDQAYCGWPATCRDGSPNLGQQFACVLAEQLTAAGFKVGPIQSGPKAGLGSVWFDYEDGRRFLRQAVIADDPRVFSLVLSATTHSDRSQHARVFEQVLRTVRRAPVPAPAPTTSTPDPSLAGPDADPGVAPPSSAAQAGDPTADRATDARLARLTRRCPSVRR